MKPWQNRATSYNAARANSYIYIYIGGVPLRHCASQYRKVRQQRWDEYLPRASIIDCCQLCENTYEVASLWQWLPRQRCKCISGAARGVSNYGHRPRDLQWRGHWRKEIRTTGDILHCARLAIIQADPRNQ